MKKLLPDEILVKFLRLLAMISGIFSLLICILIFINFFQLKRTDPLNSPALTLLQERLIQNPGDIALKQDIRQLDLMARKVFFTSQWQIRAGGYLLVACILVMIICLKTIELITPKIPSIAATGPEEPWNLRKIQRRWIIIAGILLVTFSLTLVWFTHRMLTGIPAEAGHLKANVSGRDSITGNPVLQSPVASLTSDTVRLLGNAVKSNQAVAEDFPTQQEIRSNFPSFRGPGGNGIAFQKNIPVLWDGASGKNIGWKTEIPLPGYNSPIIWKDKIFLSGAKENKREVYCLGASDGKILWTTDLSKIPGSPGQNPKVNAETGLAAPTLTTDGQRIYTIFANGDLAALDFEGKIIWTKSLGLPKNHYGHSSSLIMYHDMLIIQYDQTVSGKVIAFAGKTGEKVWETARNVKVSWASPVLANTGSRMELLLAAEPDVTSYDPATGKELWKLDCISGEVGPSVTYANGMVFSINEYSKLAAIRLGETPSLAWEDNEYLSDVPSPVAINDIVIVVTSYGVVVCYDAATGKKYWVKELEKSVYSSPMIAEGKIYILDKQGMMHILRADKILAVIGEPSLGEGSVCTPAFGEGRIYIRGNKHLFCITK
ncbi:MAG: PQQ-binding-like beta-propeller repeat protein [Bacteroidetes bacterium]|nr:PQQ-binding-like beta-propeller repeat protein [Bacteroidota bacterium]